MKVIRNCLVTTLALKIQLKFTDIIFKMLMKSCLINISSNGFYLYWDFAIILENSWF